MHHRSKLVLAGLTVALVFGAFVSASSANRIAHSGTQFRATWNALRLIGALATIECHVTIEGSYHSRTIAKVLEALVGYVSRVTVDETRCTGGSARAEPETLPWHIRYGGFSGTLPIITQIHLRIIGGGFIVQLGGTRCLFLSNAASPMRGWVNRNTATGVAESVEIDETARIPLTSGSSLLCGSSGRLSGTTNSLTEGATTTKITVTLVA